MPSIAEQISRFLMHASDWAGIERAKSRETGYSDKFVGPYGQFGSILRVEGSKSDCFPNSTWPFFSENGKVMLNDFIPGPEIVRNKQCG